MKINNPNIHKKCSYYIKVTLTIKEINIKNLLQWINNGHKILLNIKIIFFNLG